MAWRDEIYGRSAASRRCRGMARTLPSTDTDGLFLSGEPCSGSSMDDGEKRSIGHWSVASHRICLRHIGWGRGGAERLERDGGHIQTNRIECERDRCLCVIFPLLLGLGPAQLLVRLLSALMPDADWRMIWHRTKMQMVQTAYGGHLIELAGIVLVGGGR